MKIGLLVEGKTDADTIGKLVRKIFESSAVKPKLIIRKLRGRGDMFSAEKIQAFIKYAILGDDPDASKILVCVDSHCTPPEEIQKKANQLQRTLAKRGLGKTVRYCVIVHALEGWLLADAQALSKFLGAQVNIPANPESICKPKETLSEIFRKAVRSDYSPTRDNPKIAELADVDRLAKGNSSFARFRKLIKDP